MIVRVLALTMLVTLVCTAETPRAIPRPVADLLTKTMTATPAEVVALIDGWTGEAHPLLLLSRGQARLRLDQRDAGEVDLRAALKLDPSVRQAHLGLAQCAAAREDWVAASRAAAAGIDPASADAAQLAFLAGTALRAEDWRLATLAAQNGILRFPDDQALRRTELAVLVHAGRAEDARQAVLALLARTPADAELWRQLAWSAQQTGREDEALAALEAAVAVAPSDRVLRRRLTQVQLDRGLPQAALLTVTLLMSDPAVVDDGLVLLASRAAADSGDVDRARAWLAAMPDSTRSRAQQVQAARLAVQAGDLSAAATTLDVLIAAGERDATVLVWAASLAESAGAAPRAEVLYLQAASGAGSAAASATLRLVGLYLRQDRRQEARTMLTEYLRQHPTDPQAAALRSRLDAK